MWLYKMSEVANLKICLLKYYDGHNYYDGYNLGVNALLWLCVNEKEVRL